MSRYIDIDSDAINLAVIFDKETQDWTVQQTREFLEKMRKFLNKIPPAAVKQLKYGRWEEIRDEYGHLEGYIHRDCGRTSMAKDSYCPKCGAYMLGR